MSVQLFTSLVNNSTPGDMAAGGFLKTYNLGLISKAADKGAKSGLSSLAPKTLLSSTRVSSRAYSGVTSRERTPRSTRTDSGATPRGAGNILY